MKKTECECSSCLVDTEAANNPDQKPLMVINPPPEDGRCECCGKHISELNPFDDPRYQHLTGKYLVRNFRRALPHNEEAEQAIFEAENELSKSNSENKTVYDWLHEKYGEKGLSLYYLGEGSLTISPSWECEDCVQLSEDEYCNKVRKQLYKDISGGKENEG